LTPMETACAEALRPPAITARQNKTDFFMSIAVHVRLQYSSVLFY
jgi:hypothetical protein